LISTRFIFSIIFYKIGGTTIEGKYLRQLEERWQKKMRQLKNICGRE